MLPSLIPASLPSPAIQTASRRHAEAGPADPSQAPPVKRRREDPLSDLQNISRLEDLSSELHSTVVTYLPPAETVAYIQALPARFQSMSEAASAENRLETGRARTFAELFASAQGLPAIERAFRAPAIHEMLSVLKRLAQRRPLLNAAGPMSTLLADCRAASADLSREHVDRLQKKGLQVELILGMRQARNGDELHALMRQVPQLLPADQDQALMDGMRAIERLARSRLAAPPSAVTLEQVMLAGLDLVRTRSLSERAPILRAAFHAYIESTLRMGQSGWDRTRERLAAEAAALPPAAFHQAVPSYEDQFIETVSDLMRPHTPNARLALFDALLHFAPPTGPARLDALTNLASLLTELPADAMLGRLAAVSRHAAQMDPGLGYRDNIFEDLVTDEIFRALPAAEVSPAFSVLLKDIRASRLGRACVARLHDELEEIITHAPAHQQEAMHRRLARERAEH